jgi:hypothetical protein
MLNWLKKALGINGLEQQLSTLQTERDNLQQELAVFRKKEEANKAKYDSKDPWVEIRSADFSDVRGFRIELDWNEAFVQHLKESGIKGSNEEETVQKWLALLYQNLIEKLESKAIDRKDVEKTVGDYV